MMTRYKRKIETAKKKAVFLSLSLTAAAISFAFASTSASTSMSTFVSSPAHGLYGVEKSGPSLIRQYDETRQVKSEKNETHGTQQERTDTQAQTDIHGSNQSASHAEGEHTEEHGGGLKDLISKAINFLILFGGLTFVLRKPMSNFLRQRGEDIQNELNQAASSRKTSESELDKIKARLEQMAIEADKIRKDAEKAGLEEKERILADARAEADRMKKITKQEIELMSHVGTRELRAYAADLATSLAREQIKKKVTPEIQAALIDDSIEMLESLYEK